MDHLGSVDRLGMCVIPLTYGSQRVGRKWVFTSHRHGFESSFRKVVFPGKLLLETLVFLPVKLA